MRNGSLQVGRMDYTTFCSTLGYDTDSDTSIDVWRGCQQATRSLTDLFTDGYYQPLEEVEHV